MAFEEKLATLNARQRYAYDKALLHLLGTNPDPLGMFISGEGGTGKSRVIEVIIEFCRLKYGRTKGVYGAAIAMAPTGSAANKIGGYTWQSVLGRGFGENQGKNGAPFMTEESAKRTGIRLRGGKVLVLDETSLSSLEDTDEISRRSAQALAAVTTDPVERRRILNTPYGGLHVLYTGDLHQLRNVQGSLIFATNSIMPEPRKGRALWLGLNKYVELKDNCRTLEGSEAEYAQILRAARVGAITDRQIDILNTRLVLSSEIARKKAHPRAIWIANTRKNVKKLNKSKTELLLKSGAYGMRILSIHKPCKDMVPYPD
jgi:hypothetical protein